MTDRWSGLAVLPCDYLVGLSPSLAYRARSGDRTITSVRSELESDVSFVAFPNPIRARLTRDPRRSQNFSAKRLSDLREAGDVVASSTQSTCICVSPDTRHKYLYLCICVCILGPSFGQGLCVPALRLLNFRLRFGFCKLWQIGRAWNFPHQHPSIRLSIHAPSHRVYKKNPPAPEARGAFIILR